MRKFTKLTLIVAITFTLVSPALASRSCTLTGNARKQVCVCRVGNHWHGAPMSMFK